jgi:class 3 adenylate cyclase
MKAGILKALASVLGVLDFAVFTAAILVALPPLLMRFWPPKPGESYALVTPMQRFIEAAQAPLARYIDVSVPHVYNGVDLTPYLLCAAFLALSYACTRLLRQIKVDIVTLEELESMEIAEEGARRADVDGKLAAIKAATPSEREKVLEIFAESKKFLESQRRDVAFLAIDVVDSTGMKRGEDAAAAERDFLRYRKLVEDALAAGEALKAAWTPDGVMVCFATVESALGAAQNVIRALDDFNRSVKAMKADFKVRCGVNAGNVLYDADMRMEQMADRSIDLAGHLQKYAEPNSIYAPKSVVDVLPDKMGLQPIDKQVDGVDVCAWRAGVPAF